jgi:hypothetical protein
MASAPLARLVGHELDTVSFVRDDIELRIDHSIVRVLTEPSGISGGDPWRLSDECGADILHRYIGLSVVAADVIEDDRISLVFDTGGTIELSLRLEDRTGPEAAHFVPARPDGSLMSER